VRKEELPEPRKGSKLNALLAVGHPFDTIKVRLQTSDNAQFKGPLDCVLQTVRKEGLAGLYKGATPPLVGWMFMDSLYVTVTPLTVQTLTSLLACSAPSPSTAAS